MACYTRFVNADCCEFCHERFVSKNKNYSRLHVSKPVSTVVSVSYGDVINNILGVKMNGFLCNTCQSLTLRTYKFSNVLETFFQRWRGLPEVIKAAKKETVESMLQKCQAAPVSDVKEETPPLDKADQADQPKLSMKRKANLLNDADQTTVKFAKMTEHHTVAVSNAAQIRMLPARKRGWTRRALTQMIRSRYYYGFKMYFEKSDKAKAAFMKLVAIKCKEELKHLGSDKAFLLNKPVTAETMEDFNWEDILKYLKEKAPIIRSFVMNDRKAEKNTGIYRSHEQWVVHTFALLLNAHFPYRTMYVPLLHSLESWRKGLLLKSATDFAKLGVCKGRTATENLVDNLRTSYDDKVIRWRKNLEELHTHRGDMLFQNADKDFPGYQLWLGVENQGIARFDTQDTVIERTDFTEPHAIAFAVKNRVGAVDFPETNVKATDIPLKDLLPSLEDVDSFKQRMKIIVARILIDHLPEHFDDFDVVEHVRHPFLEESAQKSEMVHLGVIPENPETTKGTKEILRRLHQYVPNINGDVPVALNGDVVTTEMCVHAQEDAEIPEDGLEGLIPVPQEFSKRQQHLQDTMDIFYNVKSYTQRGTLANIRRKFKTIENNHLKIYTGANGNVKENVLPHVDFLRFVTEGMTVLLARKLLNDCDSPEMDSESLENIASKIVEEIWYPVEDHINKTLNAPTEDEVDEDVQEDEDYVRNYSRALLCRGLTHLVHRDALRENDGNAIISHWRLDMFDFAARNHDTYMKQAHNLIAGVQGFFPLKLSHEITWNRTVNVLGGPGYNLEMDLVEQFINFNYKERMMHSLNSNIDERGKMAALLRNIIEPLDKFYQRDTDTSKYQMYHLLDRDNRNGVKHFIKEYEKENLFDFIPGREHRSFPKFKYNLDVNYKDLKHRLVTFSEEMNRKRILFRNTDKSVKKRV